jgi:hypothetical protein
MRIKSNIFVTVFTTCAVIYATVVLVALTLLLVWQLRTDSIGSIAGACGSGLVLSLLQPSKGINSMTVKGIAWKIWQTMLYSALFALYLRKNSVYPELHISPTIGGVALSMSFVLGCFIQYLLQRGDDAC